MKIYLLTIISDYKTISNILENANMTSKFQIEIYKYNFDDQNKPQTFLIYIYK